MANCPNCGRDLKETSRFCTGCGTPVAADTSQPAAPVQQQPQEQYQQPQDQQQYQQQYQQPQEQQQYQQQYQQPQDQQQYQQQYQQPYDQQQYYQQQPQPQQQQAVGAPDVLHHRVDTPQIQEGQSQYEFKGGNSTYLTSGSREIEVDTIYTVEEIMNRLCQYANLPGQPYYHKYGSEYFVYVPGSGTRDMCINHTWYHGKFVIEEVERPGTFGKSVLMAGLTGGWYDVAQYAGDNFNELMDQLANELWRLFGKHLKNNQG